MAKQKAAATGQTYRVKSEYLGKEVWTILPEYERPDGAKFVLSIALSQKDLAFLYEVMGYEGVEIVAEG